jgi:hypothetical protein
MNASSGVERWMLLSLLGVVLNVVRIIYWQSLHTKRWCKLLGARILVNTKSDPIFLRQDAIFTVKMCINVGNIWTEHYAVNWRIKDRHRGQLRLNISKKKLSREICRWVKQSATVIGLLIITAKKLSIKLLTILMLKEWF